MLHGLLWLRCVCTLKRFLLSRVQLVLLVAVRHYDSGLLLSRSPHMGQAWVGSPHLASSGPHQTQGG